MVSFLKSFFCESRFAGETAQLRSARSFETPQKRIFYLLKPAGHLNQSLTDENIFLPREAEDNAVDKLAAHAARLQTGEALPR